MRIEKHTDTGHGLCRALRVTEDGLEEQYVFGIRRTTPWSLVRGAQWRGPHCIEVLLTEGRPLRWTGATQQQRAVLDDIEAVLAKRTTTGSLDRVVAAALGGPWTTQRNRQLGRAALVLALTGVVLLIMGLVEGGALLAGSVLPALLAWLKLAPELAVGQRGITWTRDLRRWHVDWGRIRSVTVRGSRWLGWQRLGLTTDLATHWTGGHGARFESLVAAARQAARANGASFASAGAPPLPDTALSPARLTETEAERGLTRVDG